MKRIVTTLAICLLVAAVVTARAQDQQPSDKYVTREEYEKLKKELDAMKAQMQQFLQQQQKAAPQQAETQQAMDDIEKELKTVKQQTEASKSGETKFLLTGYGFAGFTDRKHEDKTFSAGFNPIFLWKLNDHLLFEGEFEVELENTETHLLLEYAQLSYLLNNYMTISAGKFLNPTNFFVERLHPSWINKLPDKPLAVYDGLLPESMVGAQVRGGFPVGRTKFGYSLFVANAPTLITDDPEAAGTLEFNNFDNRGGHVAVGGRVGFLPIPQLEIGYGVEAFGTDASGSSSHTVGTLLQSVDLNYVRDSNLLKGILDLKAQWVWSHVGRTTYDPTGTLGFGPVAFNNNRNGGYAQLAYRPTKADWKFCRDLEPVFRYDRLNQPSGAPGSGDEQRFTLGLNYWLSPSSVIKLAYQFDDRKGVTDENAFQLQWALGF